MVLFCSAGSRQQQCYQRPIAILVILSFVWNSFQVLNLRELRPTTNHNDHETLWSENSHITKCGEAPLPVITNASHVEVLSDHLILNQPAAQESACGILRREWHNVPLTSPWARRIEAHQSNCSLSAMKFHVDNDFGMGSHLYMWSQALCNAWESGYRIESVNPHWLWLDQTYCDAEQARVSPFLCYFPLIENRCSSTIQLELSINVSNPRKHGQRCSWMKQPGFLSTYRAASMEYIFQQVSPVVIAEAERQASLLFGPEGIPESLITVHIRWGDKFWEMDLAPISEYIDAVQKLIQQQKRDPAAESHIYVATEDPRAMKEFLEAAPANWNVYTDRTITELDAYRPSKGNRASWTTRNTKGRAGLVALGSLLVSLEANDFVLTTKSNWSRLINELRKNVLDPRCGNCTKAIDLRPGEW